MRVRPRLIGTDLDGTLLRSDGTLGGRTEKVLRQAAAAGIAIVPATARPLRWLGQPPLTALAALVPQVVFANGAVTYDTAAGRVTSCHELLPAVAADLCKRIGAAIPAAVFAVEVGAGEAMWHEPTYPLRSDLGQPGVVSVERAGLFPAPVTKLLVKAPGMAPDELVGQVLAATGGDAEVSVSAGYGLAELVAPGVTKATALAAVAADLGVLPEQAVAFGDMPNDLPMLRWAGRAVAVGNAHPDVLAAAHEVTGRNDDDGVAAWLVAALAR